MSQSTEDDFSHATDSTSSFITEKERKRLNSVLEIDLQQHDIDDPELLAITKLATYICDCPIGSVTLVGKDYNYFLSRVGIKSTGCERINSFCSASIEHDGFFEVADILKDERFVDNYFVKNMIPPPRYYCAYTIKSADGYNIGVICAADKTPGKKMSLAKIESLKTLRDQVMLYLQLKKQNKELKAANLKAEKLSNLKDEFMSNISHDLRTPLNAINGYSEILGRSELNKDQAEAVSIIKNSSEILITLVNDILDLSKINDKKLLLEKIPFNLKKKVKLVYDLLIKKAEQKNIKLEFNFDEKIPKKIIGDKIRINQIIMNLVGNAVKFTEKGYIKINVKLNEESKKNVKVDFSIKDTGIGIEEKKLSKIFERYEQTGTEITRKYGGTGLGLNISKNLVELHVSELKVKSTVGQGSEFYFTITYEKVPENSETYLYSKINKLNTKLNYSNLSDLRLLVCEDNTVNIKLIQRLFQNKVAYLETAENGQIAIDLLKKKTFDVILMDIHMPIMDGIEATKLIRNNLKLTIPVIGFTANNSQQEKEFCLKIGMNEYVNKSFLSNEIFEKISNVLTIKRKTFEDNYYQNTSSNNKKKFENFTNMTRKKISKSVRLVVNSSQIKISKDQKTWKIKNLKKYSDTNLSKDGDKSKFFSSDFEVKNKKKLFSLLNTYSTKNSTHEKLNKTSIINLEKRSRSNFKCENYPKLRKHLCENLHSSIKIKSKSNPKIIIKLKPEEKLKKEVDNQKIEIVKSKVLSNVKNQKFILPTPQFSVTKINSENLTIANNNSTKTSIEPQDHVDLKNLKEFSNDDDDFEKELIMEFLRSTPLDLKNLQISLNIKNSKDVKFWIHKIKSPLKMFGLTIILNHLEKLNKLCDSDINDCSAVNLLNTIMDNMKLIQKELNDMIKKT
jgi:signal transduction histidine kinase/DNA-binding response OmpR family regulator/HPt (histidine-containing phosphotransfer) domain-containing protein